MTSIDVRAAADERVPAATSPTPVRHARRNALTPWLLPLAAVLCWALSAGSLADAPPSDLGLLFAASPLFAVAIVLAVLGFAFAVHRDDTPAAVVSILAVTLAQRTATLIGTDVPMYTWTYKHLGVTELIQQEHASARGLDIYNGWPGLFAATAWVSELTGISATTVAHWSTILVHLAMVGLFYCTARAWRLDPAAALTATMLFEVLNWVAQDYFAPQALALVLTLAFLTLVGAAREHPVAVAPTLVLFAGIVVTHQLTPYWLLLVLGALTVFRLVRPWWLVCVCAAMALAFLAYNWDSAGDFATFSFDLAENSKSNLSGADLNPASGQVVTSTVMRILTATVLGASVLSVIWLRRKRYPVLPLAILAFAPLAILGGQGYGGEAIFRIFLYCLVGCCLLLAIPTTRLLRSSGLGACIGAVVLVAVTTASAQAYLGAWFAYLVKPSYVAAASDLLAHGTVPAVLRLPSPAWPDRPTSDYVRFARADPKFDTWPFDVTDLHGISFDNDADYAAFESAFVDRQRVTYFAMSDQMVFYNRYFGLLPAEALPNLETRIRADPEWLVVDEGDDYVVFEHRPTVVNGATR
ncbi:hypothetical protein [Prescottella subtropica]|uniref:hypothetical protein n=1 Tax=Prescottella subtropica TaxID=2545757 RepID=UPI0010F7A28B|nr:hypothetical protein [Prescottella subtropica]